VRHNSTKPAQKVTDRFMLKLRHSVHAPQSTLSLLQRFSYPSSTKKNSLPEQSERES